MSIFEKAAESLKNPEPKFCPPQPEYKYRVLALGIGQEYTEHFSRQVQTAKFDMIAKTFTLEVCQTIYKETFDMIGVFLGQCHAVVVDFLENPAVNFSVVVRIQKVEHELCMSYGSNGSLMHKITISYDELETLKGDRQTRAPVTMVETGTEDFLTPQEALDLIHTATKKVEEPAPKPVKTKNVKRQTDEG